MENIKSDNIHQSKAFVDLQKLQYFQSLEQFKNRVHSFSFNQLAVFTVNAGVVAMWPLTCDQDTTNKHLSTPLPMEASHKIWLQVDWQSGYG